MQQTHPLRLSIHQTGFRWYYALFPTVGLLLGSAGFSILASMLNFSWMMALSPILTFLLLGIITFVLVRLFYRRWPSKKDLGFEKPHLTLRTLLLIAAVFVVTHVFFYLAGRIGGASSNASEMFLASGFGQGFGSDLIAIVAGTLLAPVVEELVYRGILFRSLYDSALRRFPKGRTLLSFPALLAITITAIAFILPHMAELELNWTFVAYFLSSAGFSLVYLMSGSMVAAMVSHSLQSMYAFGTILILGKGDYALSPIIYLIALGCPLWVYLIARAMASVFPARR